MIPIPHITPPWSGGARLLESQVRKACHDFQLINDEARSIAIALSGGKDSLTLLYMLGALRGRGFPSFDLHAIHVGGSFSCGAGVQTDALQDLCKRMNVNFILKETYQDLDTLECYSCSRKRRKILFDAAKSVGATTIAFGHHRDDNAQTLLMNLLQKGEFAGMLPKTPMHTYGVTIIRPLIYVAEKDIISFAEQSGFRRILCRCPVGQNSNRKKTDALIDEMETVFPHARENLATASLNAGSDKASLLTEEMVSLIQKRGSIYAEERT